MSKRVAVVGGIPQPIGGVTTFIRRLLINEKSIRYIFDIYPSAIKTLPGEYNGKYICESNRVVTVLKFYLFSIRGGVDIVHFNFSTPRSLYFLLFAPKLHKKVTWLLTLHHADLGGTMPWLTRWVLRRKVNFAIAINDEQREWYCKSIPRERVRRLSSYVPPKKPCASPDFVKQLADIRSSFRHVYVCSGYPTDIYNHLLAMDVVDGQQDSLLICCIYGQGDLKGEIERKAASLSNVMIFECLIEDDFNYLLQHADIYLRLNTKDSFGIAVADSINFGTPVIATNVCERYRGAFLISSSPSLDEIKAALGSILNGAVSNIDGKAAGDHFSYKGLGL